jgi:hypothetical protein
MHSKASQATPDAMPVRDALQSSAPLARLRQLMAESKARFESIRSLLPPGLAPHVSPGPLDEEGWSLLAANGAVAAKLRQLQPLLEDALRRSGRQPAVIRIKVSAR